MAYPSKYNGKVDIQLRIEDGVIKSVRFDNKKQTVLYDNTELIGDRVTEKEDGFCVMDIMQFMSEYLENCCIAESDK